MERVFWASLALIVYHYVGYVAVLFVLSKVCRRVTNKREITPTFSMIVAAYNEEKVIRDKLENALRLDYPRDRLEVIVAADGSDDRTAEIVREYAAKGVRLLHQSARAGKSAALNLAVPHARGDLVLFADANTLYSVDILRAIAANFADGSVGGVSGRKVIVGAPGREATEGEGLFWRYEAFLKELESRVHTITSADGEVFAIRRELYEPIPRHVVHDDLFLTFAILDKGFRILYEPRAVSAECASRTLRDELQLKIRYVAAGFQIIGHFRRLFATRPFVAASFGSHKVLRWTMPVLLIVLYASSAASVSPSARLAFVAQTLFYAAAVVGYLRLERGRLSRLWYVPLYFAMGNYAALRGLARAIWGRQSTSWRKAER